MSTLVNAVNSNATGYQSSTTPMSSNDLVNKAYADLIAADFTFKTLCYAASTTDVNALYNNGAAGVGATLTDNSGTFAPLMLDAVPISLTNRVLIKNQASSFQNGIYTLTTQGDNISVPWVLTRATDYDTPAQIQPGNMVPVQSGTDNAGTFWVESATVTTIGTDPIIFAQFGTAPITLPLAVNQGGTGQTSFTTNGVLLGNGASPFNATAVGIGAVLVADNAGVVNFSSTMTDGQLIIGFTGAAPTAASLTAGANITITPGAGSITIASTASAGLTWNDDPASGALVSNNGYILKTGAKSFSLPATSAFGDIIVVCLRGGTSWTITQGAGQQIFFGNQSTTSGAGGSITSTAAGDAIEIVCTVANAEWTMLSSVGNLTIV